MSVDKTRAIWIGSLNKSNRELCKEYFSDWEQKPLKFLWVTVTPESNNIWRYYGQIFFKKWEKTLNAW